MGRSSRPTPTGDRPGKETSWCRPAHRSRLRRSGVEGHLVDLLDVRLEPHRPRVVVLDIDDLFEQLQGRVVAALGGELNRATEPLRRSRVVAGLAVLDSLPPRVG